MLTNTYNEEVNPERLVVLGAAGFVASNTINLFKKKNIEILPLTRLDLDLSLEDAGEKLSLLIRKNDTLLFVSAKAPVKNNSMLIENLKMAEAVCFALQKIQVKHLIYISSDAVYADSKKLINEESCAEPTSLHGVMHLSRELMLRNAFNGPLCILRPTLIYGKNDPHNGYGPNQFMRLAKDGKDISLFGNGEELRDHVFIDDVASIICKTILHLSIGKLNIVSGKVISFKEIAEKINVLFQNKVQIMNRPRSGPMPHDGYRAFDSSSTKVAFKDFQYSEIDDGLKNLF